MECGDGSGVSPRIYDGREDGVMGSLRYWPRRKNLVHIQHITLSSLAHLYTLSLPASRTSTGTKRDSWPMASIRMPSFGGSED